MSLLVSINCITYNQENYIADAIDSFLMQKTEFDVEILIGEDCSTDHTLKVVEEYVKKYPKKIRLITSETNVGWKENEKRLLENSRGKYIALCEGDDYWLDPTKLQKQIDYMESHPDCSFCFHAAKEVNENNPNAAGKHIRPYPSSCMASMKDMIVKGDFCPTPSFVFPRRLVQKIPSFYQNAHVGDYPMQMWLSSEGYAYYMDEVMAVYRTGVPGSWTSQINSGNNDSIIEKYIKHKKQDMMVLAEFNQYTNYKYNAEVEDAVLKREFEILMLKNNLKQIRDHKYKHLYDELSTVEKLKVYSKYFFPKASTKLLELKRSIQ